jgi:hypothetical protein
VRFLNYLLSFNHIGELALNIAQSWMGKPAQRSQDSQYSHKDEHQAHSAAWTCPDDGIHAGCQETGFSHQGFKQAIGQCAAQHMVSSLIGLIDWWLAKDLFFPIERMAMIYERLIIQGTWHAMDAENSLKLPWG